MFDEKALEKFIDSKLHPPAKPVAPAKVGRQILLDKLRLLTKSREYRLPGSPRIK